MTNWDKWSKSKWGCLALVGPAFYDFTNREYKPPKLYHFARGKKITILSSKVYPSNKEIFLKPLPPEPQFCTVICLLMYSVI